MIEIYPNFYIGSEIDYESNVKYQENWRIVHACKEPYHRQLLGYRGKGAPKGHPEYLFAVRGDRLFLNLIDTDDPKYIPKEIIDKSLVFINEGLGMGKRVLVHCNLGESRSPSIGMLYLAVYTDVLPDNNIEEAKNRFTKLYPLYKPKLGIVGFLTQYWDDYVNRINPRNI